MAHMTCEQLSGGTANGRPYLVVNTVIGSADTVHTMGAVKGKVYLWANNTDTTARKLTVCLGGVTDPADLIEVTIPAESGLFLVLPGTLLAATLVIKAFCSAASVVNLVGYEERFNE